MSDPLISLHTSIPCRRWPSGGWVIVRRIISYPARSKYLKKQIWLAKGQCIRFSSDRSRVLTSISRLCYFRKIYQSRCIFGPIFSSIKSTLLAYTRWRRNSHYYWHFSLLCLTDQSMFKRLTGEQSSNFSFQWNSAPNSVGLYKFWFLGNHFNSW